MQGIFYYKNNKTTKGLIHEKIGSYKVSDIKIVAAFDIDKRKVGKDVSEAIFTAPNNAKTFHSTIPNLGVKVKRGPTLDGVAEHMKEYDENIRFIESEENPVDVEEVLRTARSSCK